MNTKKQLRRLEESLKDIRAITRVFERVAAQKMGVNRKELEGLASSLKEAVATYSLAKLALYGNSKKNTQAMLGLSLRQPIKRKVIILVSAESKYFGNIIDSLAQLFLAEFKQGGANAIVVGKVGLNILEKLKAPVSQMTFFDFNDEKPDWNIVHELSLEISKYQQVVIFYGKYKSILTQEVEREDISQAVKVQATKVKKYAFEGGDKKALGLLEKQIMSSSFMQKLYESGLAKNAVAVKVLEIGAIAERINAAFGQLAKWKLRYTKDSNNRKQTQLYGSRALWEKGGIFG